MNKKIFCIALIVISILYITNISVKSSYAETNGRTIEDGTYEIITALDENMCVDVAGGYMYDEANVQLYTYMELSSQHFKVKYIGDGYYTISAEHSGKMLDVANAGKTNETNVQQYQSNNNDTQKWIIKDAGNGYYNIISKWNGLYLDVREAKSNNETNIQVYQNNGNKAQKFKFKKIDNNQTPGKKTIEDGTYEIITALDENMCVDVAGGYMYDEANVQLYTYMELSSQHFKVKYIGDGYYTISAEHSGKMLDVANAGKTNETNVQQYQSNNNDTQKWIIKDAGNGYYNIISKWNGLYLDVREAKSNNETNIQVYQNNGNKAQKFKFKKIDNNQTPGKKTIEDGTYEIITALDENMCVDVAGGYMYDEANVQLYTYMELSSQHFKVKYIGDGYYTISAEHSGKMLDVANAGKTNETNVQQYQSNNNDTQKWIIKDAGNGYYNIISKWNGLYLDVREAKSNNETNIQVYQNNGNKAQKFKFKKIDNNQTPGKKTIEDGTYEIITALDENMCVDVAGGYMYDEANVQLYTYLGLSSQKFDIRYMGKGYYTITAIHSGKLLDVTSTDKNSVANIRQYTSNGSMQQKWVIKDAGNGYYNIISKGTGLCMTINSGVAKNEANIEASINNSTSAQKFKFVKVSTAINLDSSKYPGYKEALEKLQSAHPNWKFELLYTGVKFSDAVAGEYSVRKRNLVPTDYGGEWIAGTTLYDTGWYAASEKAIAYYMDPRNFLNDTDIFQFQDVNDYLDGVCTFEGIKNKVSGSFLQEYATDINTACKNKNVNPYYIIARLFQENGTNPKNGTYKMNGGDNKYYYNPFNIGATGDTKTEVYNNALATAKQKGWDTMEKALEGGIYFCKANWLDNYQNTLYQNRFDIDTRNGTALYTHQYMQNLMGAYNEARILRSSYANTGKLESEFTFIIPLYEGMEATLSPMPVNSQESYSINVKTTGTYVRIRSDASTDSKILRELPTKGTILLSVQRGINSNWQKVITSDGLIGYISGNYVTQIDDVTTCNYTANVKTNDGDGCNVRIGPSTRLDKVAALSDGVSVTVIDDSTYKNIDGYDWSRVRLSSGTQVFIPSKYLVRQ